jgi:hypothetical protein
VTDGVVLHWIPLGAGAGGAFVRWSGRCYEAIAAAFGRRERQQLFHSALEVRLADATTVIEMTPVWITRGERGVVGEGPVGIGWLGRWRVFRYEVRRWTNGSIPDLAEAVGDPVELGTDADMAHRVLELVAQVPLATWGRDELRTGDMWNSNSVVSWVLVSAGVALDGVSPPARGRAPGWHAGVVAAQRTPPAGRSASSHRSPEA